MSTCQRLAPTLQSPDPNGQQSNLTTEWRPYLVIRRPASYTATYLSMCDWRWCTNTPASENAKALTISRHIAPAGGDYNPLNIECNECPVCCDRPSCVRTSAQKLRTRNAWQVWATIPTAKARNPATTKPTRLTIGCHTRWWGSKRDSAEASATEGIFTSGAWQTVKASGPATLTDQSRSTTEARCRTADELRFPSLAGHAHNKTQWGRRPYPSKHA